MSQTVPYDRWRGGVQTNFPLVKREIPNETELLSFYARRLFSRQKPRDYSTVVVYACRVLFMLVDFTELTHGINIPLIT